MVLSNIQTNNTRYSLGSSSFVDSCLSLKGGGQFPSLYFVVCRQYYYSVYGGDLEAKVTVKK